MDQIKELKSQAYDLLAQISFCQNELGRINQEIAKLSQVPQEVEKPIEKHEETA